MGNRNDARWFDADPTFLDEMANEGGGDPLASFESESELDRPGGQTLPSTIRPFTSAHPTKDPGALALDQVLIRLGHITWAEAVSVVAALCDVLNASGRERVPEMPHVAITASGTVVAGPGGTKGAVGPLLARMLHSLTAAGTIPAPVRLFITKWISAGDEHATSEFVKELAYFAHPDGQAVIKALYERALATPVPTRPRPRLEETARQLRALGTRKHKVAAMIALGTSLVAVLVWRAVLPALPTGSAWFSVPSAAPVATADETVQTPEEAATVDTADGTAGRVRPVSSPRAVSPSSPTAAGSTRPASGSGVRAPSPSPAGIPSGPVSPAEVRASMAGPPALPPGPVTPAAPARDLAEAVRASGSEGVPSPIYSSADPDVTPPAFVYAQLPIYGQLPAQLHSGSKPDMNTIELIVSEAGTVERVRLISTPKRMADMMLLSVAKNWAFEPALRNGQSVKYRLEVSWAATP